jgi:hypothetical protein
MLALSPLKGIDFTEWGCMRILIFTSWTIALVSFSSIALAKTWNEEMKGMAKSFSIIMPLVFDEKAFTDPANTPILKKEIQSLRTTAQSLKEKTSEHGAGKAQIGTDPALEYMAKSFDSQLQLAYDSIDAGELSYARMALRPAFSYCISCHTRTAQGPAFTVSPFQSTIDKLKPMDRIAVYTATRQYEPALKEFGNALRDAHGNLYQIEQATRMALAVSVRVKQSPEDAMRVLDQASTAPGLNKGSERLIKDWKKSVVGWMAEKDKSDTSSLEKAMGLVKKAEATKEYLADGAGDVEYLRASSILHEYLRSAPTGPKRAEAEYALGKIYDAIRDLGFWDLHETYFEACVRDAPHTDLAKQCFTRYQDSIEMGYTGTAGTHIPAPVNKKMQALRELAYPEMKK